jgi:RNA polymerase sigma factor (sigma-70 family)
MTTNALESDVLRARGGDEAAFRRVVEQCANSVCSIALAIVRNVAASEDIAQEAFLAAWAGLRHLRNAESFLPWLRQITRNQAHQWQRKHSREVSDDAVLAGAVDARPTAADRVLAEEELRVMRAVLDELPEDAREVLLLYYREDRSTRQVSLLLGISEQAVRQRLARSRAVVREEVLRRFADAVATTAPGVTFVSMVAGAVTFAAHDAAAATIGAGAVTSGAVSLLGGAFGWAGVLMGMKTLDPPFDAREARELRRFRNVVLLLVTLGGIVIAANSAPVLRLLIAVQSLYFAIGFVYALWLPAILRRRYEAMVALDRELAAASRRRWLWTLIGRAGGAAILGTVIMAVLVML